MVIHFVCRGNTFRSRLAEAYFNSMGIPNWNATSSGIGASENKYGDITPYGKNVLEKHYLINYTSDSWTQTTNGLLEESDHVVFMDNKVFLQCQNLLETKLASYEIWDIEDILDNVDTDQRSEKIFSKIKRKIDERVGQRSNL